MKAITSRSKSATQETLPLAHDRTVLASRVVRTGAVIGAVGGWLRAAGSFAPMLIGSADTRTWL